MAWETARIRSTQSATGILYVVTIVCFLGELLSRWGYLKPDALERVLERQRHDFFGSFGDD